MSGPGNGLTWQVADHEKRLAAAESGIAERERRVAGLERDAADCTRRLVRLEEAKVDVLAERIKNLESAIRTMQRTLVGFVVTVAAGVAIALIFSSGHP